MGVPQAGDAVIVTPRARKWLAQTRSTRVKRPGFLPRLSRMAPGQLGLVADRRRANDRVIEHEGAPILLVDDDLAHTLTGATIDCRETSEGIKLTILRRRRPGAAA